MQLKYDYSLFDLELAINEDRLETIDVILLEKSNFAKYAVDQAIILNKTSILSHVLSKSPNSAYGCREGLKAYNFPLVTAYFCKHWECFRIIAETMISSPSLMELGQEECLVDKFLVNGLSVGVPGFLPNTKISLLSLGLYLAVMHNQHSVRDLFLDAKVNPNFGNISLIKKAFLFKDSEIKNTLIRLLKAGANPSPSYLDLMSAALDLGDVDIVCILLNHGASFEVTHSDHPLFLKAWPRCNRDVNYPFRSLDIKLAIETDRPEMVNMALTKNPDLTRYAVNYAIVNNKLEVLADTLAKFPNAAFGYTNTLKQHHFPLAVAAFYGHWECFLLITKTMRNNPDLRTLGKSEYPSDKIIPIKDKEQVKQLIAFKSYKVSLLDFGLFLALYYNQSHATGYLLASGANPLALCANPITTAIEKHQNPALVSTLLFYGCKPQEAHYEQALFKKGWALCEDERAFQRTCLSVAVVLHVKKQGSELAFKGSFSALTLDLAIYLFQMINPQLSSNSLNSIVKKLSFFSIEADKELEQKKIKQIEASRKRELLQKDVEAYQKEQDALSRKKEAELYVLKVIHLKEKYFKIDGFKPAYFSLKPLIEDIKRLLQDSTGVNFEPMRHEIEKALEHFLVNLEPESPVKNSKTKLLFKRGVISEELLERVEKIRLENHQNQAKKPRENCLIQ